LWLEDRYPSHRGGLKNKVLKKKLGALFAIGTRTDSGTVVHISAASQQEKMNLSRRIRGDSWVDLSNSTSIRFTIGMAVEVMYLDGKWYPAQLHDKSASGWMVHVDNGQVLQNVQEAFIRLRAVPCDALALEDAVSEDEDAEQLSRQQLDNYRIAEAVFNETLERDRHEALERTRMKREIKHRVAAQKDQNTPQYGKVPFKHSESRGTMLMRMNSIKSRFLISDSARQRQLSQEKVVAQKMTAGKLQARAEKRANRNKDIAKVEDVGV